MSNTRVSKKGTVTVQHSRPVVADAELESAIHMMASKRVAAKDLQNDADDIKKDIEAEYWDRTLDVRPIIDGEGVLLAEIKTIHQETTRFAEFAKALGELMPEVVGSPLWNQAVESVTKRTTYCKVLPK